MLGSGLFNTFTTRREALHLQDLSVQLTATDPATTATLAGRAAMLATQIPDAAARRVQAATDLGQQVAAQVVVLDRVIEAAAARMGPEHVLELRYETLCAAPGDVLVQIRDFLGSKGFAPALRPADLGSFEPRRDTALETEFGPQVEEALLEYASRSMPGAGG